MDFPDTPTRVEILEDAIQIIRGLWREKAFNFTGRHFTLSEAVNEPKPVPKPGRSIPPIWIELGKGRRLPKLVGRYTDGFNIYAGDEERVSEVYQAIEDACRMLDGIVIDDTKLFNDKLQEWEDLYNFNRPHGGLDGQTPYKRLKQKTTESPPV